MTVATGVERCVKIAETLRCAEELVGAVSPDTFYNLFSDRHPEEVYPTAERATESRTRAVNESPEESRREFWSYCSRCVERGMLARVGHREYRWITSEPLPLPSRAAERDGEADDSSNIEDGEFIRVLCTAVNVVPGSSDGVIHLSFRPHPLSSMTIARPVRRSESQPRTNERNTGVR